MNVMLWAPEQYIRGNYFQHEINKVFRNSFTVEPFGAILDIGCGDGQFTSRLAASFKNSHILGIDNSPEMIRHAKQHWAGKHLTFAVENIEEFHPTMQFNYVLSFWCLHWTNIEASLPNIFHLLKPGGRVYAVFSSLSDNSIFQSVYELLDKGLYPELSALFVHSRSDSKKYFYYVLNILTKLPFKQVKLTLDTSKVFLPNRDHFRHLLLNMPFMKKLPLEVTEDLIKDLLLVFEAICQRKHAGKLYYETRPIFLEAIK